MSKLLNETSTNISETFLRSDDKARLETIEKMLALGLIDIDDAKLESYIQRFDQLKNSPKIQEKDLRKYSLSKLIKLISSSDNPTCLLILCGNVGSIDKLLTL